MCCHSQDQAAVEHCQAGRAVQSPWRNVSHSCKSVPREAFPAHALERRFVAAWHVDGLSLRRARAADEAAALPAMVATAHHGEALLAESARVGAAVVLPLHAVPASKTPPTPHAVVRCSPTRVAFAGAQICAGQRRPDHTPDGGDEARQLGCWLLSAAVSCRLSARRPRCSGSGMSEAHTWWTS